MDERDLKILDRAITYTSRLANGVNPLDNTRLAPNEIVNQEKIRAYLQYVEQVLRKYRYDQLNPTVIVKNSVPFSITPEQLSRYEYSEEPLSTSRLCARITELTGDPAMKTMKVTDVGAWLLEEGYIEEIPYNNNKKAKVPTQKGSAAGISSSEAVSYAGEPYIRLAFDRQAQNLIIRNLGRVLGAYDRQRARRIAEANAAAGM